ncbi:hypothetical protein L218DRAFT_890089 [Marasmius fiardii PR-910]|nr:hypothetical protein L218DRAFT_890089 [Marasmius fiardii PR-910]
MAHSKQYSHARACRKNCDHDNCQSCKVVLTPTNMQSQNFVFDPRPNFPLLVTAKRYRDSKSPHINDPTALTLVYLHGTGFHKEQWEPTIDDLLALVEARGNQVRIREIWSIDAPNHGDAAILNEETLSWGYDLSFRWEDYGRATHSLLAGLGKGIDTDFSKHRLVGIGHSMGAVSLLLSTNFFPVISFEAFILVEIMTMKKNTEGPQPNVLARGSSNRRDIWPSKEEFYESLKSRGSWRFWDDRVLRIYTEHGLRSLPTKEYPDKTEGVTLKCTRRQETACYVDSGHTLVYRNFKAFTKRFPIHLVYGAVHEHLSKEIKDDVVENAIGGVQNLASYALIPNAGHLAPQTNPTGVAQAIYDALTITFRTAKL